MHRTRGSSKTKSFSFLPRKKHIELFRFSAIIEHTNQVIFMEDDDLAVVRNGALTIHRTQHEVSGQSTTREIIELKIELQQIMKGRTNFEN